MYHRNFHHNKNNSHRLDPNLNWHDGKFPLQNKTHYHAIRKNPHTQKVKYNTKCGGELVYKISYDLTNRIPGITACTQWRNNMRLGKIRDAELCETCNRLKNVMVGCSERTQYSYTKVDMSKNHTTEVHSAHGGDFSDQSVQVEPFITFVIFPYLCNGKQF